MLSRKKFQQLSQPLTQAFDAALSSLGPGHSFSAAAAGELEKGQLAIWAVYLGNEENPAMVIVMYKNGTAQCEDWQTDRADERLALGEGVRRLRAKVADCHAGLNGNDRQELGSRLTELDSAAATFLSQLQP